MRISDWSSDVCSSDLLAWAQIPNSYDSHARVFVQMSSILPGKLGITPSDQQKDVDRIRQTPASSVNLQKVVRGTDLVNTVSNDTEFAVRAAGHKDELTGTAQPYNLYELTTTSASHNKAPPNVHTLI